MFGSGFRGFFGGMEEDESQQSSQGQGEVDNKTLYELLGLAAGASGDEVKKAFRKKAVREHPDKGGDAEKFKKLTEAYEVLSNPEKKELYDKYGMEGVKNGGGGQGDINDILGSFFGMGGGRGGQREQGPKKMKGKLRELQVTLEDVFEGKMVYLKHTRKRICEGCEGKGGKNANTCPTCKGKKMVQKLIMLGPGMYSQQTAPCSDCRGEGVKMDEKDRCKKCKGVRVMDVEKKIEVPLEKGVPDEHDYTFYGESDEMPGIQPGDLYIRIRIEKNDLYERRGADLYTKKKISLVEALTGTQFQLKYLDGGKLNITTSPGSIISPGQVLTLKKRGMPFYKDAMGEGDLHIQFEIEFPKPGELKPEQIEILKKVFPNPPKQQIDVKKLETLEEFDSTGVNNNPEGGKQREEEEDDQRGGGGQRVQCAQQ